MNRGAMGSVDAPDKFRAARESRSRETELSDGRFRGTAALRRRTVPEYGDGSMLTASQCRVQA